MSWLNNFLLSLDQHLLHHLGFSCLWHILCFWHLCLHFFFWSYNNIPLAWFSILWTIIRYVSKLATPIATNLSPACSSSSGKGYSASGLELLGPSFGAVDLPLLLGTPLPLPAYFRASFSSAFRANWYASSIVLRDNTLISS